MAFDLLKGLANVGTVALGPLGLLTRGTFEGGKALVNAAGQVGDPNTPQEESMAQLAERLRPEFLNTTDVGTGKLKNSLMGDLQSQLGGINLNTQGLEAIRQRALSSGPSAWAKMAEQKQGLEEQQARNQSVAQGASAQAQARSQLAMRGGLSGGARQRLAMQGARDQAARGQQVGAQGQLARANIGLQDEQQRTSLLSQLPGMEVQSLQPQFQKLGAWQQLAQGEQNLAAQGLQAQNQANMQKYQSQLQAQAAEKQAQATERAGKK